MRAGKYALSDLRDLALYAPVSMKHSLMSVAPIRRGAHKGDPTDRAIKLGRACEDATGTGSRQDLDGQVVAALRRKAELHGHSLEQELRQALTSAPPSSLPRSGLRWRGAFAA